MRYWRHWGYKHATYFKKNQSKTINLLKRIQPLDIEINYRDKKFFAPKTISNLKKVEKMQKLIDDKHRYTLQLLHINVRINELIDTYNL